MPQHEFDLKSEGVLVNAVRIQFRCIRALLIREMMVRYGRENLGFLWVFVEPMILCAGVSVTWSLIRGQYEHGVPLLAFVLSGYMPLTLWRHLTNGGIHLFRRSFSLMYHRHLTILDVWVAQNVLEFLACTCAFVTLYGGLWMLGLIDPIQDLSLVAGGWLLMAFISTCVSLIITCLTEWSETSEHFVGPFQYLMLPVSGTFFLVDWLPDFAQNLIWFNPTSHCYEMIRAGFFGEEITPHYNIWYPLLYGLVAAAGGLWVMMRLRQTTTFT